MKYWKWFVVIALVSAVVLYRILMPAPALKLNLATVTPGRISEYIEEEGKTRLDREKRIYPSMAGYLGPVAVAIGEKICQGTVIARIEDIEIKRQIDNLQAEIRALQAQNIGIDQSKPKKDEYEKARLLIEQAKGNLKIARQELATLTANFAQTERELRRTLRLFTEGAATIQQKETIETRYRVEHRTLQKQRDLVAVTNDSIAIAAANLGILQDSADDREYLRRVYRAQIEGLQARLAILRNNLKKTELVAPFDGVVLERTTRGNTQLSFVTPDYYIVKIGDLASIEIQVDLLSDDIHRLEIGQPAQIYGPALGQRRVAATVAQIYPSAFTKISSLGIEQQRVTVILHFDNAQARLQPGYRVDVKIFTRVVNQTLVIPTQAVFTISRRKHVFVVTHGKTRLQAITVGIETDDLTEVLSGLSAGQQIVANPGNDLAEGRQVEATKH